MLTALIIWVAFVMVPGEDGPRVGTFEDEASCQDSIERVRGNGIPASDCVKVTLPKPYAAKI